MNLKTIQLIARPVLVATTILAVNSAFAATVVFHVKNQTSLTLTLAGSQAASPTVWDRRPQGTVPPNGTADWICRNPNVFGGPTSGSVSYKLADNLPTAVFSWDTSKQSFQANMPNGYFGQLSRDESAGAITTWTINVTVTAAGAPQPSLLKSVGTAGPANGITLMGDGSVMPNVSAIQGLEVLGSDLAANPAAAQKTREIVVDTPFTPVDLLGALAQIKAAAKKTLVITLFDAAGKPTSKFKLDGCVPIGVRLPNLNAHDHRGATLGLIFTYQSVEVS